MGPETGMNANSALGAGGREFESRHPDRTCSHRAYWGKPVWHPRSSDHHLAVELNASRRGDPLEMGDAVGARPRGYGGPGGCWVLRQVWELV